MKPVPSHDPARWRERDADAHTIEARAAVLADGARPVPPLAAAAVSRIRADVLAEAAERQGFVELRRRPLVARVAVGLALLLLCGATADGAGILWRHLRTPRAAGPATPPAAAAPPPTVPRPVHRTAASDSAGPTDTMPEGTPAPGPAPLPSPRHLGARARASAWPVPSLAPEVPEPRPAPATEADMVAAALSQLRQHGDPRAALATLDAYARAFPHGVLEPEAARTRVEAVLRLDDRRTALTLLDGMSGLQDEPGTDLLLTRAELRAAAGRFREALADFTRGVEGEGGPAAASERALYGRAVCFGRLADDDRARADLLAYQQRFPNGRFAGEVRRLLSAPTAHP